MCYGGKLRRKTGWELAAKGEELKRNYGKYGGANMGQLICIHRRTLLRLKMGGICVYGRTIEYTDFT